MKKKLEVVEQQRAILSDVRAKEKMDLEIRIRLATAVDAEKIASLLKVFRQEEGLTNQRSVPLPVDHSGPQYVLLAEVNNHPVGIASLQRCHQLILSKTFLLLTDIYVIDEYRRHGVATSLLNEGIALGRRIQCDNFTLFTKENDRPTLATAARAGFTKHPDLLLDLKL